MIDIETTQEDLVDYLEAKRVLGYKPPVADLGYCLCGTIWNIEAMAAQGFVRGQCPQCGEEAAAIEPSEKAEQSA